MLNNFGRVVVNTSRSGRLALSRNVRSNYGNIGSPRPRSVVGIENHRILIGWRFQSNSSKPSSNEQSEESKTLDKKKESVIASSSSFSSQTTSNKQQESQQQKSPVKVEEPKKTLWEKVKHEAQHYWDGTKLLGYEVKVSTKLVAKMLAGYELTRRENRQLKRTVTDMGRLVPFSMFVIIPFAELLLPFALKLFPNLLPSTYESGKDKEVKSKKLRRVRGDVSQYLRQTVTESGMALPLNVTPEQKEKFTSFFKQVRASGEQPSRELVLEVARLFKDDTVLDNLSRPQLVAMAKYINLQPFGTNLMLRYSIRHKMKQIKRDDRAIDYEGVDSLSVPELQLACASRGIKTYGVSPGKLRDDLGTWLELRLHQKVPSTLLVLSSAYTYGEAENVESYYDGIQAVLSALPEELFHEAELEVSSESATNKQRLEVIKEQEELIEDENKEEEDSGHVIKVKDNLSLEEEEEARQKQEQLESSEQQKPEEQQKSEKDTTQQQK